MKRIAVLGAGGFVGGRLLEMAVGTGIADVVPVVRSCKSLGGISKLGVAYKMSDVSRVESLQPAIGGCEVVLNLTIDAPWRMGANTAAICQACRTAGVQLLIHISSAEVYGRVEDPQIHDDSLPDRRHWMAYARGKGEAELVLRQHMNRVPFSIVALRPGLVWGPRSFWTAAAAQDLMEGRAFLVNGGTGICNLMFIDNLLHSVLGITRQSSWPSGFYNVADDEEVTWGEYYGELARHLNFDARKVTVFPPSRYVPSLTERLRELRQRKTMCRFQEMLPSRLRPLLERPVRRALGLVHPITRSVPQKPRVTRQLWHLQQTRHKLKTDKFSRTFGKQNRYSFAEGMEKTCAWLRFAGFVQPPEKRGALHR